MSFTAVFMNQTGALVHVYTDGTVLVSHGGTEMGQVCAHLGNKHGCL
jgi:xanthine dehydrogenase molybdopterin-binding subunit B